MLALSLSDVKSETTMREQEEEDQHVGLHKKWRPTYIESVLAIGLVLVLGLVGLRFYWDRTELKSAITLDVTDPVELLAEFQAILAHLTASMSSCPAISMMQQRTAGCYGILTTTSMCAKAISSALSRNHQFQERT
jgi:predicted negative regulator of RcsB-dependent stress response